MNKFIKNNILKLVFTLVFVSTSLTACNKKNSEISNDSFNDSEEYQALIKEAYNFKKTGNNKEALKLLNRAAELVPKDSVIEASSLDDRASIFLRTGEFKKAEEFYLNAIKIIQKTKGNYLLLTGIENRLKTLYALKENNLKCKESDVYPNDSKAPYFPIDIQGYQTVLGTLTEKLASCSDSKTLEPVSIRVVITGDGKFVRAYARHKFAGTKIEQCVVERLKKLIPETKLPKFGACFRGFSYPYMVGQLNADSDGDNKNSDSDSSINNEDSDSDNFKIPLQNSKKTTPPSFDTLNEKIKILANNFNTDPATAANDLFFPKEPFLILKDSKNPAKYYRQLLKWYNEDIKNESKNFKANEWEFVKFEPGSCKWKAPGTEFNKIGYYSCVKNSVTLKNKDEIKKFEINVLINWGNNWYITHLGKIHN
ncbi:MAG: tetratricopeptide repeat protein [Deltaproteobacteria bacterium]|nr:tetratricopeptide repeat protein [Deltaproteobacteria bacterium]